MGHVKKPGSDNSKLALKLGDRVLHSFDSGSLPAYRSAVALLRTVFEDHFADPEHGVGLLLLGHQPDGLPLSQDFTVIHRGSHLELSDFTQSHGGPSCVQMPLKAYVREVVRFGEAVLAAAPVCRNYSDRESRELMEQRQYLLDLVGLGRATLGGHNYWELCEEFHMVHGSIKQPLRLEVMDIMDDGGGKLRAPQTVQVKIRFGPLCAGEKTLVRPNGGDAVLATVQSREQDSATLLLEGIGPGGLAAGDQLIGLQCFYP